MTKSFENRTRELMRARPHHMKLRTIVADNPGAGFSIGWLSAFQRQTMTNPSLTKVEALYNYLSGNTKPRD